MIELIATAIAALIGIVAAEKLNARYGYKFYLLNDESEFYRLKTRALSPEMEYRLKQNIPSLKRVDYITYLLARPKEKG